MPLTKDGEAVLAEYKTTYGKNGTTIFFTECLQNDGIVNGKSCYVESTSAGAVATDDQDDTDDTDDKHGTLILGDTMKDKMHEEFMHIWGIAESKVINEIIRDQMDLKKIDSLDLDEVYTSILYSIVKLSHVLSDGERELLNKAAEIILKKRHKASIKATIVSK